MFGIIICAPVKKFPMPPKDQKGCELDVCPHCETKIWISAKKRALKDCLEYSTVYCYDCVLDQAIANPANLANSVRVDI